MHSVSGVNPTNCQKSPRSTTSVSHLWLCLATVTGVYNNARSPVCILPAPESEQSRHEGNGVGPDQFWLNSESSTISSPRWGHGRRCDNHEIAFNHWWASRDLDRRLFRTVGSNFRS